MTNVNNPLENYESFYKELILLKKRLESADNIIDEYTPNIVQFVKLSDRWITVWLNSENEIKNLLHMGNYDGLIRRIVADYNEINIWLENVKKKNPIISNAEPLNGNIILKHINNPETKDAKTILPYHNIKSSLFSFYTPIIEAIESVLSTSEIKKFKNDISINTHQESIQESKNKPQQKLPKEDFKEFSFINNFDRVNEDKVIDYFKKKLVEQKYISNETLDKFLKSAFEVQKAPKSLFSFDKINTRQDVIRIFYNYYKIVAAKPHGKQLAYIELLGEYFEGFETSKIKSNFNK